MTDLDDAPVVTVWRPDPTGWVDTGQVAEFDQLTWTPTFNDVGSWQVTLPFGEQASVLTDNIAGLVTIDWRSVRTTWGYTEPTLSLDEDTGQVMVTVTGVAATARLGWETTWPDPTAPLDRQPVLLDTDPAPYQGPAETVIKQLITGNWVQRRGDHLVIPTSLGLGETVLVRPQQDNLFELVQKQATVGRVGFALNLVDTAPGRADLTLEVWVPSDRTREVLLTAQAGTLAAWTQSQTAPTATKAIVAGGGTGGMDRVMQSVTTPESEAVATVWGGHRVIFVDGPSSFDPAELTQAGVEALAQGAETMSLAVTIAEVEGQLALRDYLPGDTVPAEIVDGAPITAQISSLTVTVDDQDGVTVAATIGDPDATDPDVRAAQDIRLLARGLRRQERK